MAERSGRNTFLANVILASPALIGFFLGLYEASRLQEDYGVGVSVPEIVPGPILSFQQGLMEKAFDVPALSLLGQKLIEAEFSLGVALFSAIAWTLFLCIPLVVWGLYLHWWSDEGLESRGRKVHVAAWLVAAPGMILGLFAAVASVVLLLAVGVLAAIAYATFSKGKAPTTAVDAAGNLFKKQNGKGFQPVQGPFGQKRDTNLIGQPKVQSSWGSPKAVRRNPFEPQVRSTDGRKLYHRKDE